MAFNINTLTLGEIDKVETLSGVPITALGEDSTPQGKITAALAYVVRKRQLRAEDAAAGRPPTKYEFTEALDLTMEDAQAILGIVTTEDEDADPTDGEPSA